MKAEKINRKLIYQDEVSMSFVRTLKERRIARGLSRKQCAKELNIRWTMLSDYECGARTPCISRLIKLAKYYNYDLSDSINHKIYYKRIDRTKLRKMLKRYGFTAKELSELTNYSTRHIEHAITCREDVSLQALGAIYEVIKTERKYRKEYSKREKMRDSKYELLRDTLNGKSGLTPSFEVGKLYLFKAMEVSTGMSPDALANQDITFKYLGRQGIHHCFQACTGGWTRTYTDYQLVDKKFELA